MGRYQRWILFAPQEPGKIIRGQQAQFVPLPGNIKNIPYIIPNGLFYRFTGTKSIITMNKMITILLCLLFLGNLSQAQFVTIQDTSLRTFLKAKYPSSFNSANQMDTTSSAIINEDSLEVANTNGIALNVADLTDIHYFKSLRHLACRGTQITSLPANLPASLEYLDCSFNYSLVNIPSTLPNSITSLLMNYSGALVSFPRLPASLIHLEINNDLQLDTLPPFPSTLKFLEMRGYGYEMTRPAFIPPIPNTLTYLEIDGCTNSINSINHWPDSLQFLDCSYMELATLPALPTRLQYLYCQGNELTSLPSAIPASLLILSFSDNKLASFPANLPSGLQELYCSGNLFTSMNHLPPTLNKLDCSFNTFNSNVLPVLPNSVYWLSCGYCHLTSIPVLPSGLGGLNCNGNNLTSLPALPAGMYFLGCSYNQLTSLPAIPYGVTTLQCSSNNIHCLPALPYTMLQLSIDTLIHCLPNRPPYMTISIASGNSYSLPICNTSNNSNNCPIINPVVPGAAHIKGPLYPCGFVAPAYATYYCNKVPGVFSYKWSVPYTGVTSVSHPNGPGENDTVIHVSFASTYAAGNPQDIITLKVFGYFAAGPIDTFKIRYSGEILGVAGAFMGNPLNADPTKPITDLCEQLKGGTANAGGTPVEYKIRKVAGASYYVWSVTNATNAGIVSVTHPAGAGVYDTVINVLFDINLPATNTSIKVQAFNECHLAGTAARTLYVKPFMSAAPGLITGTTNACTAIVQGTNYTYSIKKVSLASGYKWFVTGQGAPYVTISHANPPGSNDTLISIHFNAAFKSGVLNVQSYRNCGTSNVRAMTLTVTKIAAPATISGNTTPCPQTDELYRCTRVVNANGYIWKVPLNASFNALADTAIMVHYPPSVSFKTGMVSVQATSVCLGSTARSISIVKGSGCLLSAGQQTSRNSTIEKKSPAIENTGGIDLVISPNPTKGDFTISLKGPADFTSARIIISSVFGQVVYDNMLKNPADVLNIHNSFSNGVYFVSCIIGTEKISKKIIINR